MDIFANLYVKQKGNHFQSISDLERISRGLYYKSMRNELEIMEVYNILEGNETKNQYKISDSFLPFFEAIYPGSRVSVQKINPI